MRSSFLKGVANFFEYFKIKNKIKIFILNKNILFIILIFLIKKLFWFNYYKCPWINLFIKIIFNNHFFIIKKTLLKYFDRN